MTLPAEVHFEWCCLYEGIFKKIGQVLEGQQEEGKLEGADGSDDEVEESLRMQVHRADQ